MDGTGVWAGELQEPRLGWTQLDSAVLSFTNPAVIGNPTNPVTFNPVTIRKAVNKLTPQLFSSIVTGTPLRNNTFPADLTLEFVTTGVAGPVVFFRIELRYLIVSSQQTLASKGDTDVLEEVQIQFGAARLTSWPITPAGGQGAPKIDTWNRIRGNTNFNDVP
jgi:type VI protein secretion system component Hcp